jgi:hypothetical protein
MLDRIRRSEVEDPAFDEYLSACESYYRRQMLIDEHAPSRPFGPDRPTEAGRFVDRNT